MHTTQRERDRPVTRGRSDLGVLFGGLALLVVCAIPASSGRVGSVEQWAFEAINRLPDALEPLANAAQFLGVLAIGPVVAVIALIARRPRLAIAALLATAGKLLGERALWEIVQRERPAVTEPGAIIRGGVATTGLSFVSGHVCSSQLSLGSRARTCTGDGGAFRGSVSPWWRSRGSTSARTTPWT